MKIIARFGFFLASACLLLAVPVMGGAYEVNVLRDEGSQWKNIEDKNYSEAIRILEERVAGVTRYRDVKLTNLCTAYVLAGRFDEATKACDKAVEANGKFVATALNSRGVLRALQGYYGAASADFEKAQTSDKNKLWASFAKSRVIKMNEQVAAGNLVAVVEAKQKDTLKAGLTR